jgi:hypothetical protein
MRFEPGPGMGGHCLPVDPFYLTWKAREYDFSTEFIELAGKVNQYMPYVCLKTIERALNDAGKPVRGSRILVVGASYKAGVGDLRESPALKIIELLQARGAELSYHDPHVPELPAHGLRNVPLSQGLGRRRSGGNRHRAPERRPRGHRARGSGHAGSSRRHPRPARSAGAAALGGSRRPSDPGHDGRPPLPHPSRPR